MSPLSPRRILVVPLLVMSYGKSGKVAVRAGPGSRIAIAAYMATQVQGTDMFRFSSRCEERAAS